MSNILVSIIIPMYNVEPYIKECVYSAIKQTLKEIEIICIDDCSPDNSKDYVKEILKLDNRVSLIIHEKNKGISATRNTGIKHAKGKYILPLDGDDIIHPNYCLLALEEFKNHPELSVVYCKAQIFCDETYWEWNLPEYSKETMLAHGNCVFCTALFKKQDWERFGGYNTNMVHGNEDYDFWLNFSERDLLFKRIDTILFYYRQKQVEESRNKRLVTNVVEKNITCLQLMLNHSNLFQDYLENHNFDFFRSIKTETTYQVCKSIKIIKIEYLRTGYKYKSIYNYFFFKLKLFSIIDMNQRYTLKILGIKISKNHL